MAAWGFVGCCVATVQCSQACMQGRGYSDVLYLPLTILRSFGTDYCQVLYMYAL